MNILQTAKTIQVASGTIEILYKNIFYVKCHPNTMLYIDDFKEIKAHYNALNINQNLKILVEFQQFNTFTIEARNFAEQNPVDIYSPLFKKPTLYPIPIEKL
jgi:hypothetical protein